MRREKRERPALAPGVVKVRLLGDEKDIDAVTALQAEPGAQLAGDEPLPGCPTCGAPSIPLRAPGPDSAAVLCLSCGPALSQPPQTPAGGE